MQIEEQVPLAPLTTFHIGGKARFFARARMLGDLRDAASFAKEKNVPVFVLGGGSNVLVSDEGFEGLVINIVLEEAAAETPEAHTAVSHSARGGAGEKPVVTAAAGESWDSVVAHAVDEGLWGLENLSGIPGTVGGAVVQNIGAYGAALSQMLLWAEAFDIESGEVKRFLRADCAFGYRDSAFKRHGSRYVVVRAAFALSRAPTPDLSYKDLAERFAGAAPELQDVRSAVLEIRRGKFPDIAVEGTAGSFFKNPIVSERRAAELRKRHPDMPLFTLPETEGFKVPLAYLLDKGLGLKRASVGGARLFERQPLVIAARRGTSSRDVEALAKLVADRVSDSYGIAIEPEVRAVKNNRT